MSVHPLPLSAFGDEAGPTIAEQVRALLDAKIGGLDVRSVDGVNVLDMPDAMLAQVREACEAAGLRVQAVGSPVNKVPLSYNTREEELRRLGRAIEAARLLGTRRIRIFSPEVPYHQREAAWLDLRPIMGAMVELAEEADVVLLHENDGRYFGAFPDNAKRLFEELGGPYFRAAFDFANTVLLGFLPMRDWFPWLLPHVDTLHVKDARAVDGQVVPAGEGDGQLVETLSFMLAQRWHGTLTLEPHLASSGPSGGFSGPESFALAADRMKAVIGAAGGEAAGLGG